MIIDVSNKNKINRSFVRTSLVQVLPVQTGLYWYDEWMVQEINDKNLNGS